MPKIARAVVTTDIRKYVLELNAQRSEEYTARGAQNRRREYRLAHPTEILVDKCMDGRLNLSVYTGIPRGILQPFRNIGGKFHLGWPLFQEVLKDSVRFAFRHKRNCLAITSYHFSEGSPLRGCAGFGYDTAGAKAAAFDLREQYRDAFKNLPEHSAYCLTIGIETDHESLIFHGNAGEVLAVGDLDSQTSTEELDQILASLYPDMHSNMRRDLLPLVSGNLRHVAEVRSDHKLPVDLEHREQIIAVGRGFDWLHEPNRALIIGPYSHEWPDAVFKAGGIVLDNLRNGRIPEESGVLLLVATLWREEEGDFDRALKVDKARYIVQTALKELQALPDLQKHLQVLVGVVHDKTRKLNEISLC